MSELITAFGLGNAAILNNVCLLPLYPGLVAFLAGNADQKRAKMGVLGVIVLAGVLTMMTLVAVLLHLFSATTNDILPILLPIIYGLVAVLGLMMLAGYNPWSKLQSLQAPVFKNTYATAYVYGLLLGPMTLPCIAPLIVTAFALGANDARELVDGMLYFLAFGIGFGWPLVVLPLIAVHSQKQFIGWMTKKHTLLTRVSGVLLVGIAVLGVVTEVIPNWSVDDVDATQDRWEIGTVLEDHTESVHALVFSGEYLISAGGTGGGGLFGGGSDFAIRQWTVEGELIARWAGLTNATKTLAAQGDWVAAGGWENVVTIWQNQQIIERLAGHSTRIQAIAFSENTLATGSEDGLIQLWRLDDGIVSREMLNHPRLTSLAVHENQLASGSLDNTIWVWNVETGERMDVLEGHANWVLAVAFDPRTGQLASASADGSVRIWENGETIETLMIAGQTVPINTLAFDPDGRFLAVGGGNLVVVWKTDDWERPAITFRQHEDTVLKVTFSLEWLASADEMGTVRLWRVPRG